MKRTLLALALGLVFGLGAHLAWFGARHAAPVNDFDSQLAWMKRELRLVLRHPTVADGIG